MESNDLLLVFEQLVEVSNIRAEMFHAHDIWDNCELDQIRSWGSRAAETGISKDKSLPRPRSASLAFDSPDSERLIVSVPVSTTHNWDPKRGQRASVRLVEPSRKQKKCSRSEMRHRWTSQENLPFHLAVEMPADHRAGTRIVNYDASSLYEER
jgi:hypothetical protein